MKKTRTPLRKAMALALSCTMALGMAPAAAFAEAIEPDDVTVEQIDVEDQAEGLVAEEDGVATLEEEMLIEGDGDAIAPEASDEAVAENGTITAQSQWRGSTDLSDGYFFLLDGDTGGSKDYYVKEGGSVTPTVTVYYYSDDEEGDSEGRVLLDPSKYELSFYKWNDETGDWDIPTSTPLYAASTGYLVVATAKSGSGLTGSCDVCFNVYGPYDLLGATLEFPGIGAGNRVDAGKTLTPVVKINGAVVPSSGYTLEYESEDTDEITTTFPTAVGKYYVYVEGVEPYKNWVYGIIYVCAPISSATVSSVAAQTYTGDMECILVDDCGTDNSMQIVREWIKRYCGPIHFQLTGHQTNRGLSAARNTGIVVAQGDYIFFLDSDDAITPDCIDTLILIAEKYPEAEFVQGNTVRGTGNVMHSSRYRCEVPEYCADKDQLIALILSKTLICAWNKLIKRSFLIDKQVFFAEGLLHEDLLWSYNLAKKVCAAAFTNSETYSYYINQNSILTNNSTGHLKHRYESLKAVAMFILNDLQQDAKSVVHPTFRVMRQSCRA